MDKIEDQDNEQEKLLDKLLLERLLNRLDEQEKDMILRDIITIRPRPKSPGFFRISQVQVFQMKKTSKENKEVSRKNRYKNT